MMLKVNQMTRPSMAIQRIEAPDGGSSPGLTAWKAINFIVNLDPFDVAGSYSLLTLELDEEQWDFINARVAMVPGQEKAKHEYVMIFDGCRKRK